MGHGITNLEDITDGFLYYRVFVRYCFAQLLVLNDVFNNIKVVIRLPHYTIDYLNCMILLLHSSSKLALCIIIRHYSNSYIRDY